MAATEATSGIHHNAAHPAPPGYRDRKAEHLARLAKVEGQVRGLSRMVEGDRYCIDVLTQISAATHALQEIALGLIEEHVSHCVLHAARQDPDQGQAKLDEVTVALRRTLRL